MENASNANNKKEKSTQLTTDFFEREERENQVQQVVAEGRFSNQLYISLENKIYGHFEMDPSHTLAKDEITCLTAIVDALHTLLKATRNNDATKTHNNYNVIYRACYDYLYYRVKGIYQHLNTGNVAICYSSPETFEEHKNKQLDAINHYTKENVVKQILETLHTLAPSLFHQAETTEEYLLKERNPYEERYITFMPAPHLVELNEMLLCLKKMQRNQPSEEILESLEMNINKFSPIVKISHILDFIRKFYVPMECLAYYQYSTEKSPRTDDFLKYCLSSVGMIIKNSIPYHLIECDSHERKNKEKKLKSSNDFEEKYKLGQELLYSKIPWNMIRNIALLTYKDDTLNRPQDKELFSAANHDLQSAWKNILSLLQDIVLYEINVATQQIDYEQITLDVIQEDQYESLQSFSYYATDVIFLNKVVQVLQEVKSQGHFLAETHLRLLSILGECAKNISPQIKKLISKEYWAKIAKVRDKVAHSSTTFLRRLLKTIRESSELSDSLNQDYQILLTITQETLQRLPMHWEAIQDFYTAENSHPLGLDNALGDGLNCLLETLDPILTPEDYQELRATRSYFFSDIDKNCDQILEVLNQHIAADTILQVDFFAVVDGVSQLSNNQKKEIKEAYKNLRKAKDIKVSHSTWAKLTENKTPVLKLEDQIEGVIKILKAFNTRVMLENALRKIGLHNAIDIWEQKRQKYQVNTKPVKENTPTSLPWSLQKILEDSLEASNSIVEHLDTLNVLTRDSTSQELLLLNEFWGNPMLCYAVEFHFTRIRIYVNIIQDALSYLPRYDHVSDFSLKLNELYQLLALKLKEIRLFGNSLAHLHDVTHYQGMTIYGHRMSAYNELWRALENYKSLFSLHTHIQDYIGVLTGMIEATIADIVGKIGGNRERFSTYLKWQQQAIAKLPGCTLADFQIITAFKTLDNNDPDKNIKKQLYDSTLKILQLHHEYGQLLSALSQWNISATSKNKGTSNITIDNKGFIRNEVPIVGDRWNKLNAIGIKEPEILLNKLKDNLHHLHIRRYLRDALLNQYQDNITLNEDFSIEGDDSENNAIRDRIISLCSDDQNTHISHDTEQYIVMMNYLERSEVQRAYIHFLIKTRYMDSNIIAACLWLEGKNLVLLVDYHLPNGELLNLTKECTSPIDENSVCLIVYLNNRQAEIHYSLLRLTPVINESNSHYTNLISKLGVIGKHGALQEAKDPAATFVRPGATKV